ncbi:hypothetical protein N431DRAFT_427567 [Stipitochalara longipes BDJ]|nr:hypothetical protein N431DRAFT_427567 [Stipitochalara longipes BDJ]
MSHSDNLYSAEESDHESFSDELSPADGYFNRGVMSANAMVPDPSLEDSKEPEAKTLIPPHLLESMRRGSRLSNPSSSLPSRSYASPHSATNSFPSGSSYTATSPVASRRLDDLFPRRPASINGPPPAYTPSPEPIFSPTQERVQRIQPSQPSHPRPSSQPSQPSSQSPPSPPDQPSPITYSTFPEQHLERGYLPRREEPESMGSPEEIPSESTPLSTTSRSRRQSPCRNIIRKLLLVALVFTITTTLLTTIFGGRKSDSSHDKPPKDEMPPFPDRPIDSTGPYCISAIYRDDMATYEFPIGADLTIMQITHDGDDRDRAVKVRTAGEIRLRRIPKDSSHGKQAFLTVDVHVSDPNLYVVKTWDHESRVLQVSTPKYARLDSSGPHCVSLEITAWFPEDAEFSSLLIESFDLTLRVIEDIKINVSGQSKFATVVGQVAFPSASLLGSSTELPTLPDTTPSTTLDGTGSASAWKASANPPFSSRRILVETVSGSITGCYPLMDYLGLIAQSGSIKVDAFPQPVLPDAPAPAELEVQTASGSIEVNLPVRDAINSKYTPPPRNYITRVHSSAGGIKGSYYLGSTSNFRSMSGSIYITTMPVLQAGSADESGLSSNTFETHTVSGSIKVEVLDPIFITMVPYVDKRPERPPHSNPYLPIGDDDPYIIIPPSMDKALFTVDDPEVFKKKTLRNLKSSHGSQSASVSVSYPAVWEGTFHAKTISGSIRWAGDGLRIIRDKKGYASHEVLLRKGVDSESEGCFVEMSGIAGSLHFVVGSPI